MDPIQLEELRLLIAALVGAFVSGVSALLAFKYAQRLQADEHDRRDIAVYRALCAEVDENIKRIGTDENLRWNLPGSIGRSAWDLAREIDLPLSLSIVLGDAYALGERMNIAIATRDGFFAATAGNSLADVVKAQAGLETHAREVATQARGAFQTARDEFRKSTRK